MRKGFFTLLILSILGIGSMQAQMAGGGDVGPSFQFNSGGVDFQIKLSGQFVYEVSDNLTAEADAGVYVGPGNAATQFRTNLGATCWSLGNGALDGLGVGGSFGIGGGQNVLTWDIKAHGKYGIDLSSFILMPYAEIGYINNSFDLGPFFGGRAGFGGFAFNIGGEIVVPF
jgi:hypothetical protein